jgi:hypothetical protein
MKCSVCPYDFEAQYRFCRGCGNDSQNPVVSPSVAIEQLNRAYETARGGETHDYRDVLFGGHKAPRLFTSRRIGSHAVSIWFIGLPKHLSWFARTIT